MVVVMAAACHPEAQDIVQDELDNIVGCDRGMYLPSTGVDLALTVFAQPPLSMITILSLNFKRSCSSVSAGDQ